MADFDPDAYLAEKRDAAPAPTGDFDPDAYLRGDADKAAKPKEEKTALGVLESATDPYGAIYGTGQGIAGMAVGAGQIAKNRMFPGIGEWLRGHPTLQDAATAVKNWTMEPSETATQAIGRVAGPAIAANAIPGVGAAAEAAPFLSGLATGTVFGGLQPTKSGTGQEIGAATGLVTGGTLGMLARMAAAPFRVPAQRAATEIADLATRNPQLAQAAENIISRWSPENIRALGEGRIPTAVRHDIESLRQGDPDLARTLTSIARNMRGDRSILTHLIGHGVSHGVAAALSLPHFLRSVGAMQAGGRAAAAAGAEISPGIAATGAAQGAEQILDK
jgi:hypothetical protein